MKKIFIALMSMTAVMIFTGCGASKVQKLSTSEASQLLVIGKTTEADVRQEFGKPDYISTLEKSIAKQTMETDINLGNASIVGVIKGQIDLGRSVVNSIQNENQSIVSYWKYKHYKEIQPSGFAVLRGATVQRKGAILILVFNEGSVQDSVSASSNS